MTTKSFYLWGFAFLFLGLILLFGWALLRIILAIILILAGITILKKGHFVFPWCDKNKDLNTEKISAKTLIESQKKSFSIVFSNKQYIVSEKLLQTYSNLSFYVLFSECTVYIPPGTPYRVRISYGLSSLDLPKQGTSLPPKKLFGKFHYRSKAFDTKKEHINISIESWFSRISVLEKKED